MSIRVLQQRTLRLSRLFHLYFAILFVPILLLMAYTGGCYLLGYKGSVDTVSSKVISIETTPDRDNLAEWLREQFRTAGIEYRFESIKHRSDHWELRPSSKRFFLVSIERDETGNENQLKIIEKQPSLQAALIELHKGHGPKWFRWYQIVLAVSLFAIVILGLIIGILTPRYRSFTVIGTASSILLATTLALL